MRFDLTVKQRKAFSTQMKKRIEQELKKALSEKRKELKKLQKELEGFDSSNPLFVFI